MEHLASKSSEQESIPAPGMSTRRSPRLTGPSPKPELPPKPRPPKRVKDVAADSVRQANFQAELAEWEAAKLEHANLMKIRKAKKTTAWKAASKSAAEAEAPPPAAPLAPLAPTPQLSADEARLVGSPALAERGTIAAVPPPPPPPPPRQKERLSRLSRSLARWVLDVEAVAARCGAEEAQPLYRDGNWYDLLQYDGECLALPLTPPRPRLTCVRAAVQDTNRVRAYQSPSSRTSAATR